MKFTMKIVILYCLIQVKYVLAIGLYDRVLTFVSSARLS